MVVSVVAILTMVNFHMTKLSLVRKYYMSPLLHMAQFKWCGGKARIYSTEDRRISLRDLGFGVLKSGSPVFHLNWWL